MEFTLPIFLKLFPNMLPSTFKEADKEVTSSLPSSLAFQLFVPLARQTEETAESEIRSGEILARHAGRHSVEIEEETLRRYLDHSIRRIHA